MERKNKIIKKDILIKVVIPCFVVIMIILLLNNIIIINHFKINKISIDLLQLITAIIVTFIGFYVFLNKNRDDELNYLELDLNVLQEENYLRIKTSINNPTNFDRDINFAFLIISRTDKSFLYTLNQVLNTNYENTNNLIYLKNNQFVFTDEFAFIPLKYYYKENIKIGNEKLIYEIPISSKENDLEMKFYNVRFFVYPSLKDLNSYHRCVSSSFGINGNLNLKHVI